jgi:hypothetical protein
MNHEWYVASGRPANPLSVDPNKTRLVKRVKPFNLDMAREVPDTTYFNLFNLFYLT